MHLILGKGQLGMALRRTLAVNGHRVEVYGKRYPDLARDPDILGFRDATVWNCVGDGSVERAREGFDASISAHLGLSHFLMTSLHESCKLILFSSDYALEGNRSEYGLIKEMQERLFMMHHRDRTACIRITTLYGPYRPLSCFPGKLLKNFPTKQTVTLPLNHVTPTPVDWLADRLVREYAGYIDSSPHDVCPDGSVSILNWGRMILPPDWEVIHRAEDETRPVDALLCDLNTSEDWETLWNLYKNSTLEAVRMHLKAGSISTSKVTQALFNGT